jgi:hypothetical protein
MRVGRIDINCQGILNARLGTFTGPSGTVRIGDTATTYSVDTAGRVRGSAGFYSAVGSVFGDNVQGIRVGGSIFTVQTASGVDALAVENSGNIGARLSVATTSLGLADPVAPGSACTNVASTSVTNAASTTARAAIGGGLVLCSGGTWVAVSQLATLGAACAPDGISATSSTDGRSLICRNGVFMLVKDLQSAYVTQDTVFASRGTNINKPACGQMGATTGTPLAFVLARNEGFNNNATIRRFTVDNGPSWTVGLTDTYNTPLTGEVIVETRCYY